MFHAEDQESDALKHIELPLKVSLIGVPLIGALAVMAHSFFGVDYWLSVVALALVFVFCLIAINSTGLTSITPSAPWVSSRSSPSASWRTETRP